MRSPGQASHHPTKRQRLSDMEVLRHQQAPASKLQLDNSWKAPAKPGISPGNAD